MSFAARSLRPAVNNLAKVGPAPAQVRNMATLREIEMRSVHSSLLASFLLWKLFGLYTLVLDVSLIGMYDAVGGGV
jgi:hypothetical protein